MHHLRHLIAASPETHGSGDELDEHPGHGAPASDVREGPLWRRLLWEGGFPLDGFLTAASAQVRGRACMLAAGLGALDPCSKGALHMGVPLLLSPGTRTM